MIRLLNSSSTPTTQHSAALNTGGYIHRTAWTAGKNEKKGTVRTQNCLYTYTQTTWIDTPPVDSRLISHIQYIRTHTQIHTRKCHTALSVLPTAHHCMLREIETEKRTNE